MPKTLISTQAKDGDMYNPDGSHSRDIHITLIPDSNGFEVRGSHQAKLSADASLELDASGGDGFDGLHGVNGKDGLPGKNGIDATHSDPGTNGENGGNGEPGLEGTNGGNAGNGGLVEVTVNENHLGLLELIDCIKVYPGRPGSAGVHGQGGKGGAGGRGGKPADWQENNEVHYRDDNDQMQVRKEITHHHMAGGHKGKDGDKGFTPNSGLYPGSAGNPGKVIYSISRNGQVYAQHTTPYQLSIELQRVYSPRYHDSFFEPGDNLIAAYTVKNNGLTMPSPSPIPIVLNSPGFQAREWPIIQESLAPNQSIGDLLVHFTVPSTPYHAGANPLTLTKQLSTHLHNMSTELPYKGAMSTSLITFHNPVNLQPIASHSTLLQGQTLDLTTAVNNITPIALGAEFKRNIRVEIVSTNADDPQYAVHNIQSIAPKSAYSFSHNIGFASNAELGERRQIHINLYIQPLDTLTETLIQRQTHTLQLSPAYSPENNGFVLIINAESPPEAIRYWTQALNTVAGKGMISIWNTSHYGPYNLDSITVNMQHGTVFVLDNDFKTGAENTVHFNSEYIQARALLNANMRDVSVTVLGNNNRIIIPFEAYDFLEDWAGDVRQHFNDSAALINQLLNENDGQSVYKLSVPSRLNNFFGDWHTTSETQSRLLQQKLFLLFPNRRYHIGHERAGERIVLTIRRLADALEYRPKIISFNSLSLADPEWVESFPQSIISTLPFVQKLQLFAQHANPYHQLLAENLAHELINEQNVVRESKAYGSILQRLQHRHQHNFYQELLKLQLLVDALEAMVDTGDQQSFALWSPLVLEVIERVQLHAQQHSTFWSRLCHYFVPQTTELVKETTNVLCHQARNVQGIFAQRGVEQVGYGTMSETMPLNRP